MIFNRLYEFILISNRYKNILILLLIVTTSPAWADWAAVLKNNSDTHYIDHTNIRRNGQFVKVWALKNSKRIRIDCIELLLLNISITFKK